MALEAEQIQRITPCEAEEPVYIGELLPIDALEALHRYALNIHSQPTQGDRRRRLYPAVTRDDLYQIMRAAHQSNDPRAQVHTIGDFIIEASLTSLAAEGRFDASGFNIANGEGAAQAAIERELAERGLPNPVAPISAQDIAAEIRERALAIGTADTERDRETSDEPIMPFLLAGNSRQLKRIARRALELIENSDHDSPTFQTAIRGYLQPEFREGEGWERAKAAMAGHHRKIADKATTKHTPWIDDSRYSSVVRGASRVVKALSQWVPGTPPDISAADDGDGWIL